METILFILYVVLVVVSLACIYICVRLLKAQRENIIKQKEVTRRLEILIRMTAQHELFIDTLKNRQEELIKNRNRGAR